MANNSKGSNRPASSRQNQGKRPGGYSERYSNRPNPYTGYLPPGTASAGHIYHPESVDPVRIKQLEREQEQARLHAYEDRANMPHSPAPAEQNTVQRQPQPASRSQNSRSVQEAARRGKQTRRSQVAQQQAAKAVNAQRRATIIENNAHLNEIRQNAIDEAEKLRNKPAEPAEIPVVIPEPAPTPVQEAPKENIAAAFPVAGAAQFAAINNKKRKKKAPTAAAVVPVITDVQPEEQEAESSAPVAAAIPVVIPSAPVEVITPDAPDMPNAAEETADTAVPVIEEEAEAVAETAVAETAAEEAAEETENTAEEADISEETEAEENTAEVIPVMPFEDISSVQEAESTETADTEEQAEESEPVAEEDPALSEEEPAEDEAESAEEEASSQDEASDAQEAIAPVIAETEDEPDEAPSKEEADTPEEEPAEEITEEPAEEIVEEVPANTAEPEEEPAEESEEDELAEEVDSQPDYEDEETADEEEPLPEEEEEDDVKVYVPAEKVVEEEEYSDEAEDAEEYTPAPVIAVPTAPKRRNFETRISSELADPSAYSPGVAQDETLFIRKKRPEEATAVFSASTPGLAPDFDDDDFFEQWLEEGDDMIIKDKRQRRKVSALIGAVTMTFAVIGFIFVIAWFIRGIPTGSNSSGTQTDYAKFILPVVNADPEPFETITSVDNNILVEAAINRLTYGEAAADQTYTALEVENETRLLIPAADVEKSGKVLFGDTFTIDYTVMYAIEDEMIYYYSAADNCFHVVTTSGDIEPEVIKISHIGSRTQVLLEVGYISATEEAMEGSEYYKQMEYVLNALDDGKYYVSAIRAMEN